MKNHSTYVISILTDYYCNKQSYGKKNAGMKHGDKFCKKDLNMLSGSKHIVHMLNHHEAKPLANHLIQTDSHNCAVISLWYFVLLLFDGKEFYDFDPNQ